jgi:hypothetical protein
LNSTSVTVPLVPAASSVPQIEAANIRRVMTL